MNKVEVVNIKEVEERLAAMVHALEQMPIKMKEEMGIWATNELHRDRPDIEQPDSKTVVIRKKGRYQTLGQRAVSRFARRLIRRWLTPKPIRILRRYARIGRRPLRLLMPAPIRRLRRFERQMRRVARGRPTAVYRAIPGLGRIYRMQRRAKLQAHLWQGLLEQMGVLGKRQVGWQRRR